MACEKASGRILNWATAADGCPAPIDIPGASWPGIGPDGAVTRETAPPGACSAGDLPIPAASARGGNDGVITPAGLLGCPRIAACSTGRFPATGAVEAPTSVIVASSCNVG